MLDIFWGGFAQPPHQKSNGPPLRPPLEHGFRNSELEIRMQIVGKSILICLKKYFLVVLIILVFLHLCMIAASAAS